MAEEDLRLPCVRMVTEILNNDQVVLLLGRSMDLDQVVVADILSELALGDPEEHGLRLLRTLLAQRHTDVEKLRQQTPFKRNVAQDSTDDGLELEPEPDPEPEPEPEPEH